MIRTHRWAKESLTARRRKDQMMYGIVQGGPHRLLRRWSARVIGKMPFECLAVGGSFSRDEMPKVLDWVMPLLPEEKPVHLLGIGKPEDLFEGVERGIDTFDCVIPTREARHGRIWTSHGPIDIKKSGFTEDSNLLDLDFVCPILERDNICRKDLHKLFKEKDQRAGYYATAHNVFFFNKLMEKIRLSIKEDRFSEFKQEFLKGIKK
jgi:queuine tRNA-ribosyltransferase